MIRNTQSGKYVKYLGTRYRALLKEQERGGPKYFLKKDIRRLRRAHSQAGGDGAECPVCLVEKPLVGFTSCRHAVCKDCVVRMCGRGLGDPACRCPICRTPIWGPISLFASPDDVVHTEVFSFELIVCAHPSDAARPPPSDDVLSYIDTKADAMIQEIVGNYGSRGLNQLRDVMNPKVFEEAAAAISLFRITFDARFRYDWDRDFIRRYVARDIEKVNYNAEYSDETGRFQIVFLMVMYGPVNQPPTTTVRFVR